MKRPGVVQQGTSRDLADHGEGYSANGESEHTRQSAHSHNIKLPSYREATPRVRGPRSSTSALIAECTKALAKLKYDLTRTDDPIRLAKIKKNIAIKSRFIVKIGGTVEDRAQTE